MDVTLIGGRFRLIAITCNPTPATCFSYVSASCRLGLSVRPLQAVRSASDANEIYAIACAVHRAIY